MGGRVNLGDRISSSIGHEKLIVVVVLFFLTVMSPVIFSATLAIRELYMFGDSLSDTGTLSQATNGMSPFQS